MSSVVAGTQYRGQFEERMKKIVAEMSESDGDILFLDEMHTMMGAGAGGGSMDAGNILKYVILNCLFFFSFFLFFFLTYFSILVQARAVARGVPSDWCDDAQGVQEEYREGRGDGAAVCRGDC